ncbi:hypothetical protein ES703_84132 [subsurface metagenome]
MNSGFSAPGTCGRCGYGLTGKVKDEITVKPGKPGWAEILRDHKNFKLFGCMDCGTESPHLEDLTAVTPELALKRALQRKAELERSIPFYEGAISKMKEELPNIEKRLPELMRKVGERE